MSEDIDYPKWCPGSEYCESNDCGKCKYDPKKIIEQITELKEQQQYLFTELKIEIDGKPINSIPNQIVELKKLTSIHNNKIESDDLSMANHLIDFFKVKSILKKQFCDTFLKIMSEDFELRGDTERKAITDAVIQEILEKLGNIKKIKPKIKKCIVCGEEQKDLIYGFCKECRKKDIKNEGIKIEDRIIGYKGTKQLIRRLYIKNGKQCLQPRLIWKNTHYPSDLRELGKELYCSGLEVGMKIGNQLKKKEKESFDLDKVVERAIKGEDIIFDIPKDEKEPIQQLKEYKEQMKECIKQQNEREYREIGIEPSDDSIISLQDLYKSLLKTCAELQQKLNSEREKNTQLITEFLSIIIFYIKDAETRKGICLMNYENMKKEHPINAQCWWDKANIYTVIINSLNTEKEKWTQRQE